MSVLAVFAIVFAYFVAYYDDLHENTEQTGIIEIASPHNELLFETTESTDQSPKSSLLPAIINEKPNQTTAYIMKTEIKDDSEDMDTNIGVLEIEPQPKPDSDSLDDLLNFAFSHKEQNNYHVALDAFMRAYKLYHDNEVAPFLVVEIGNILKYKGFYDEAINIFMEGRTLPILKEQQTFEQEFVNTIAYLRIIKNILLENHMNLIPFKEIPPQIQEEIDNEFQNWRNLA
jgi:tetratricopeptide (TPR) repeat protein